MTLPSMDNVKNLIQSIQKTKEYEIGCADCFAVLDQYMELVIQGNAASDLMPLVQDHLDRCGDCHEEFEALLVALRARFLKLTTNFTKLDLAAVAASFVFSGI